MTDSKSYTQKYEKRAFEYLKLEFDRLIAITEKCSVDMHEPDNQGIEAIVTGFHLDNAMGIDHPAPYNNHGEFLVRLRKETSDDRYIDECFNLADLIALAR